MKLLKFGTVLLLAAVVVVGLMLPMTQLFKTELPPRGNGEAENFEVNSSDTHSEPDDYDAALDLLKDVEAPPAPPKLDIEDPKPPVRLTRPFPDPFSDVVKVKRAILLVRIPPVFPPRFLQGNESGYCKVNFDVSPEGLPLNVTTTICTDDRLKKFAIKSVQKWKYTPLIVGERPAGQTGLEETIRFELKDENGYLLPLLPGC